MDEKERTAFYRAIEDWIRLTRLSGGVRSEEDIDASRRSVDELVMRFQTPLRKSADPMVLVGSRILWAYMVASAGREIRELDDPPDYRHVHLQIVVGRLAATEPDGPVRKQLLKAAKMDWRIFQSAMAAIGITS